MGFIMRNFQLTVILLLIISVVGCSKGGKDKGGDDDKKPLTPISELTPNNIPPERQEEWAAYVNSINQIMSGSIAGVYDSSLEVDGKIDQSYLIVEKIDASTDVKITAYNYMLDDIDKEGGCYRIATKNMVNSRLNEGVELSGLGSIIKMTAPYQTDSKVGSYQLLVNNIPLKWNYDKDGNLLNISYGSVSSQSKITVIDGDTKLVVPLSRIFNSSVSEQSIKSNICTGEQVDEDAIGSTNFAGLYDVTLEDSNKTYETYLYIDEKGSMLAYKYMADDFSLDPKNCYSPSNLYNRLLNDRTLKFDRENKRFYTLVGQSTYYWNLDENGNIVSVARNSEAASNSVVSYDDEISIGITKETSFTLTDIQNNICQ